MEKSKAPSGENSGSQAPNITLDDAMNMPLDEFIDVALKLSTEQRNRLTQELEAVKNAPTQAPRPANTSRRSSIPQTTESVPVKVNRPESKNSKNAARKKQSRGKMAIAAMTAVALGAGAGGVAEIANALTSGPQTSPVTADDLNQYGEQTEKNVGELSNGVHYDYREYSDYENKTSQYAYGYNKSECFNNSEATADAWMDMAQKAPEYSGSYAYYMFTDAEKADLSISGMNADELDDYMSNAQNIDGGAKQQAILEKLDQIAHDKENTQYDFYYENDSEYTYYITFIDANNDGECTPDELRLGYQLRERHNAPQVNVMRKINGQWVKMIDLNMECGFQPNETQIPEGLQEIPTGASTSTTPTPQPEPEPEPQPTPAPQPEPEPTPPPETIKSKDAENLIRIDKQIQEDIADDIGTDRVVVHQTSTEEVEAQTPTKKPTGDVYEGTEATIVQNQTSTEAEPVQSQVSPANDYSQNLGGAHEEEYAPVPEKEQIDQTSTAGDDLEDILREMGIN